MARLLLDEHLPVRLELALRALGHDIDDDLLLEQAAIHRRILITLDRDFTTLHHAKRHHFGIVVLRRLPKTRGVDPDEAAARLFDDFCRCQRQHSTGNCSS